MRPADASMQLLDNGRHIVLRSGGCGTYLAASYQITHTRGRIKGRRAVRVSMEMEAEVEGFTPSEALLVLTEAVKALAIESHKARRKR